MRRLARAVVLAMGMSGCGLASVHAAEPRAMLNVTLITQADDPRMARSRLERHYLGHPEGPVRQGLDLAIDDGRFELEAARVAVVVAQQTVDSPAAARAAAQAAARGGAVVLLTDLSADWTLAVADAVALPVINIGNADDRLREQDCRARLFHVGPSERMRADALAQTLVARNWRKVLLLQGPGTDDRARGATVQAALRRFGLQVVETRLFKPSGDPRERDLANPLLLTAGGGYDVVWVVDADGEFARGLPYRIASPRPVVGDAGLVAVAWHAQFERFGAPQVSRRFARAAGRLMAGADWSAWMAGKALVAAATVAPTSSGAAWARALAETPLDGAKGVALSFRAWDRQLRQTLLLTDGQGVVSQAPVDGLLHPTHTLDTLGADSPERRCKTGG